MCRSTAIIKPGSGSCSAGFLRRGTTDRGEADTKQGGSRSWRRGCCRVPRRVCSGSTAAFHNAGGRSSYWSLPPHLQVYWGPLRWLGGCVPLPKEKRKNRLQEVRRNQGANCRAQGKCFEASGHLVHSCPILRSPVEAFRLQSSQP